MPAAVRLRTALWAAKLGEPLRFDRFLDRS